MEDLRELPKLSKKLSLKRSGARYNKKRIFESNSSFYVKIAYYEKSLISIFQELFVSINKMFILAVGLGTGQSFYGV